MQLFVLPIVGGKTITDFAVEIHKWLFAKSECIVFHVKKTE